MTGQFKHYNHGEHDPFDLIPFVRDSKLLALVITIITLLSQ